MRRPNEHRNLEGLGLGSSLIEILPLLTNNSSMGRPNGHSNLWDWGLGIP